MSTLTSLQINSLSNPTTENGKLEIGIYYNPYPFNEQSIPNIFINSTRKTIQCSAPVSSINKYITTCQIPPGTVINNDCNGILIISGNRFITKLNENKVKVIVNNKEAKKLANSTYDVLLVSSPQISYTPFNVSVYIGPNLVLSNVILNHLNPNVTKINQDKNNKDGLLIKMSGIGFTDSMNASLVLPNGSQRAIKCKLQCSANLESTIKINTSNGTGYYLCNSKAIINQDSIGLKMIFNSKLIEFNVDIDMYKGNDDDDNNNSNSKNNNNSDSSKPSSPLLFILITIISILFYLIESGLYCSVLFSIV
ncbi:hypothetical protein ACTFIY_008710 [Dictyostelium cf. discoideum]